MSYTEFDPGPLGLAEAATTYQATGAYLVSFIIHELNAKLVQSSFTKRCLKFC